jgi:hypothetical protein
VRREWLQLLGHYLGQPQGAQAHAQRRAAVLVRRARVRVQRHSCNQPQEAQAQHSGERPYACDEPGCEFSATAASSLKEHKRTHSGERPYACDENGCDYRATTAGHLKAHKRARTAASGRTRATSPTASTGQLVRINSRVTSAASTACSHYLASAVLFMLYDGALAIRNRNLKKR